MSQMNVNSGNETRNSDATIYERGLDTKSGGNGCWARRTTLERCLGFSVLLTLAATISLVVALATVSSNDTDKKTECKQTPEVCTTYDCLMTAIQVVSKIDVTVDPCDDFYSYACGAWIDKTQSSSTDLFTVVGNEIESTVRDILKDNKAYAGVEVLDKSKRFYAACVNTDKIQEVGDAPLRALLHELGGWPIVNKNWNPFSFNLTSTLVQLSLMGQDSLFHFSVVPDTKHSSVNVLRLDYTDLGMCSMDHYLGPRDDGTLMAYQTLMLNIANALGADPHTVQGDVQDVVDFEIQLANISASTGSKDQFHPSTLQELVYDFSGMIDWKGYLHRLFGNPDIGVTLENDEPIHIWHVEYFSHLLEILDRTHIRTLANYLIWRITKTYAVIPYKDLYQNYSSLTNDCPDDPDDQLDGDCVSQTTKAMGMAVGHMYIAKNFDNETRDTAVEMVKELKKAFNEQLNEPKWMDKRTKAVATEKCQAVEAKVAYPEQILNITYLTQYYENLTVRADNYFNNTLSVNENKVRRDLRKLQKPVDKNAWTKPPMNINAQYQEQQNEIDISAGILRPPFFSKSYPRSMNFGCVGVIIGHEITHGFDDQGRKYDKDGNLRQWWSKRAVRRFKKQTQCLVDQYSNFFVPGTDTNGDGVNTLSENIADNGGIRESFMAYRNWVKGKRNGLEEALLPGLNFTQNQLFFLSFAQGLCSKSPNAQQIHSVKTDPHSLPSFRVTGTLQNSEDFSRAFNCPRGSYMNPKHKCVVW